MNSEDLPIPGGRDVRATLDTPEDADSESHNPEAIVVACPPHPQHRGHRGDARLEAVSEDARNALRWARDRYDRVGLFGFSFGGAIATLAAATVEPQPDAVSLLAPASRLTEGLDAAAALADVEGPVQVVYGTRDDTADWKPLVERAEAVECEVVEMSADHFFVGQHGNIADLVGDFLIGGSLEL
jgi:alpha/beta superfamily hydrolase